MILLHNLKLHNFLSHSDTELSFRPQQKLLISGISGSGKSSIVDAIVWALYGQGRTDNKFIIRHGEDKAKVTLKIFDDESNKYYQIIRTATPKKNDLEILHSSNDNQYIPILVTGLRSLQEFIEKQLLHSSYLLFLNSICYQQGNPESFANQTAAGRKDLLLELARTADYDEYYDKAKDAIKSREVTLNEFNNSQNLLRAKISVLDLALKDLELDKDIKVNESAIEQKKSELLPLSLELEKQQELKNKLSGLTGQLTILQSSAAQKNSQVTSLQEKVKGLQSLDSLTLQLEHQDYEKAVSELGALDDLRVKFFAWSEEKNKILSKYPIDETMIERVTSERDEAAKQLIETKKNNETKCIHCGKICPRCEDRIKQTTKFFDEQIYNKEVVLKSYKSQWEEKQKALKALEEPIFNVLDYNRLSEKVKSLKINEQKYLDSLQGESKLKETQNSINSLTSEITSLNTQIQEVEKQILEISSQIDSTLTIRMNRVLEEQKELERSLASLKIRFTAAQKARDEQEILKKELDKNELSMKTVKTEVENLTLLKEAFGSGGIKVLIVDYIIPRLEEKINEILSQLSDFRIRLDTQKSGLGKDITLEGLFVSIINDRGEELGYDSYSGGEKLKITIAISEALSSLQKVGFRILDELIIGIDAESVEGFVRVLNQLQARFSQFLCISHLREIQDLFEEKIKVVKLNGISKIVE